MCHNTLCWLAYLLSAIGAMNWGFVVFFKFNFIEFANKVAGGFGLDKVISALIALSGLYAFISLFSKI